MCVLIVDERSSARRGLRAFPDDAPIEVVAVTSSLRAAVSEAARLKPDVALLAAREGEAAAFQTIAGLKRQQPGIAVIVLADSARADGARRAIRAGASGYLDRSLPAWVLAYAVTQVARGGVAIDPRALSGLVNTLGGRRAGPSGPDRVLISRLDAVHIEILRRLAAGRTNAEIAADLGFTEGTVKNRVTEIYRRTGVANRAEAAYFATRSGLLD